MTSTTKGAERKLNKEGIEEMDMSFVSLRQETYEKG